MASNPYDEYYEQLPFDELLSRLRSHRRTGAAMAQDWHDALISHLQRRNLSPQQREQFERFLAGEEEPSDPNAMAESTANPPTIDPDAPSFSWLNYVWPVLITLLGLIRLILEFI